MFKFRLLEQEGEELKKINHIGIYTALVLYEKEWDQFHKMLKSYLKKLSNEKQCGANLIILSFYLQELHELFKKQDYNQQFIQLKSELEQNLKKQIKG